MEWVKSDLGKASVRPETEKRLLKDRVFRGGSAGISLLGRVGG
jgi:hypothetical protein